MPTPDDQKGSDRTSSPKPKTNRDYEKKGRQLLRRARNQWPDAEDAVAAFAQLCADSEWVLRSSTTRLYKAAMIKCIEIEVAEGRCDPRRAIEGIERITELLKERRGRPAARTSRLKFMGPTEDQLNLVVDDLKRRLSAEKTLDLIDAMLLGYVLLAPSFGLRPCECQNARIMEADLVVSNAKFADYRAPGPDRHIPLELVHKDLIRATAVLISRLKTLIEELGSWERLHDILAERLARICHRLGLPRISLYSLRHIAIATWKRAGFDRFEIAALAGHISIETAWRHYAPAKFGWNPKNVCVKAAPKTLAVVRKYSKEVSKFRIPEAWSPPADWINSLPSMNL
jgi:integrase